MNFGLKRKIVLVLVSVLALSATVDALLASYYTNRQNEESAFAGLGRELRAWQNDLQTLIGQLRKVATAAVGDVIVLNQLAELEISRFRIDAARIGQAKEEARALAYGKTVSLNRLYLVLRTGGFSSIAVYNGGKLSHYVSESGAGMLLHRKNAAPAWVAAAVDADGNLPFQSWPAWDESRPPPSIAVLTPDIRQPTVSFSFPAPDSTMIEVAIPVQGVIEDTVEDYPGEDGSVLVERAVTHMAIAGPGRERNGGLPQRSAIFAVVVFRKPIDRAYLQEIASKTGNWPVLFSSDGSHRQQLSEVSFAPEALLRAAGTGGSASAPAGIVQRALDRARGSFYVALLPWQFEHQPRLILGLASSRESTLQNIRQTVTGILMTAALTLILSTCIGIFWMKRFIDPIIRLTAAVKEISGKRRTGAEASGLSGTGTEYLRPIALDAPDEVGDLTAAFNVMIGEHRLAFETLEQRVQARTGELRQQARYLRALIDTLPLVVWIKDAESGYLAVNQATATACGRSVDEMVGKSDLDCWPPELAQAYRADDAWVMAARQPKTVEESMTGVTGTVWIETFKAPVLDEDGTVLGTVGAARDISTRKAAEAARDAALSEATRLARLRSDFIAQMSHELRTPLNAILGYAQILRRERDLTPRQANGLATIEESGQHLLALINDILDLSRIEADKLELSPTDVNLALFLQVVSDIMRVKADEKSLLFCYHGDDLPASVRLDDKRLRQVLLNLLGNAVKFTDCGEVSLRVLRCAPAESDAAGAVRLRFAVQDSGIGMDEAQLGRIFQPFEQVGDARRREGGAGLGLAISRQLVRLMGGDITVESVAGQGSVFWFELALPLGAGQVAAPHTRRNVSGYAGPRRKVLVVDDVPQNRAMLVDLLTLLGFDAFDAANGEQGLALACALEPDLIVMDLMMPVMDGLEATRKLRCLPGPLGQVPVIVVTASATTLDESNSYAAGASAFIAKPIEQELLLKTMEIQLALDWIHEAPAAAEAAEAAGEDGDELLPPPHQEMEVLHQLALAGNMRKIRERADYLKQLDARYAPFAKRLHSLAEGYRSKAIVALVERYLA